MSVTTCATKGETVKWCAIQTCSLWDMSHFQLRADRCVSVYFIYWTFLGEWVVFVLKGKTLLELHGLLHISLVLCRGIGFQSEICVFEKVEHTYNLHVYELWTFPLKNVKKRQYLHIKLMTRRWLIQREGYASSLMLRIKEMEAAYRSLSPPTELSLITLHWFLTAFASVVHIKLLLRIWDLFFYQGSIVLFQTTLGMLSMKVSSISLSPAISSHYEMSVACEVLLSIRSFLKMAAYSKDEKYTLSKAHTMTPFAS